MDWNGDPAALWNELKTDHVDPQTETLQQLSTILAWKYMYNILLALLHTQCTWFVRVQGKSLPKDSAQRNMMTTLLAELYVLQPKTHISLRERNREEGCPAG